jgi:hypothetical protein
LTVTEMSWPARVPGGVIGGVILSASVTTDTAPGSPSMRVCGLGLPRSPGTV